MAQSVHSSTKVGITPAPQSDSQSLGRPAEAPPVEVFPPEIVFKDIETEQVYEVTVCVRNLSSRSRRIRFNPPHTVKFTAKYQTLGALAVGIPVNVIISFETDQLGDFHDEMEVYSEDFHFILPLHAYQPSPDLRFDSFVNLGFTAVGKPISHGVNFHNYGSVRGEIRIRYDKQMATELTLKPDTFFVEPGKTETVALTYLSREVNNFRCGLSVDVEGQPMVRMIEVSANCIEQQIALVGSELKEIVQNQDQSSLSLLSNLDFSAMYHGQRKEVVAYLVNVSPFSANYSIKFHTGPEEMAESESSILMTPQELATQSIKRVVDAFPLTGEIPAYSQVPIKFICNSKHKETEKGFSHNMMEEWPNLGDSSEDTEGNEVLYIYTAVFSFKDSDQKLRVQLQAKAVFPKVKISDTSVHFYECPVGEKRDFELTVENQNPDLPLDFHLDKIANFNANPRHGVLHPRETKRILISFKPANLGKFEDGMHLAFLKGTYQVPLLLSGESSSIARVNRKKQVLETSPHDFGRTALSLGDFAQSTQQKPSLWRDESDLLSPKEEVIALQQHKRRYNDYLRESRSQRLFTLKKTKVTMSQTLPRTLEEIEADTDFLLSSAPLRTKPLKLPHPQTQLYVEKPLGPYDATVRKAQEYSHDPLKPIKNVYKRPTDLGKFIEIAFNERPLGQLERKESTYALTPFDLKLVSAGPKQIDFGEVVIKCEVSRWFSVVNDLKQHLFVELIPDLEEVKVIDPPSLVIPPGQKGGFRVALWSVKKQHIVSTIKYVLNGKYEFHFMIQAEVQPAVLELAVPGAPEFSQSPPYLFFRFDEGNMSESLTREVQVMNKCTANTKFRWTVPPEANYQVEPLEQSVEAGKQLTIKVKFTPGVSPKKNEEEMLTMWVENGETQTLICKGDVSDANCTFLQKNLDFGTVAVGLKHEKSVTLRNLKPKTAIFYLRSSLKSVEVTPTSGKIIADGKSPLKIVFSSPVEMDYDAILEIVVRGGRAALQLPIHAKVIEPRVFIPELEVDFGGVTVGSQLTRKFNVTNNSEIPAVMYLSLEDFPEFDISVPPIEGEVDNSVLVPATSDKDSPFYIKEEDEDLDDPRPDPMMDEDEEEEDEEEEIHRKFKISVQPLKTVSLQLKFSPTETEPRHFLLPLLLAGINETPEGLARTVTGEGLKPRFFVEFSVIDFKNKVITPGEKSFAVYKSVLISNPEMYPVHWRFDCSEIDKHQFFSLKPMDGILEPGSFLNLRAGFNPLQPISYEGQASLYLDDAEDPYLTIVFQGAGTVPRITFDRREVLLPVVPLNIQSKVVFCIANDGYENLELGYEIRKDPGNIDLKLNFLDGKQLGITKPKIAVEVTFTSSRTVSFTNKVEFFDSEGVKYPISISGTADNSLLTAYSFIQRNPDEVRLVVDESGCVTLIQDVQSDVDSDKGKSRAGPRTGGSSVVSVSARSIIGYSPVPQMLLERSLDFLARWLNHTVLTNPVNKIPDDIVNSHGAQLYEIIYVMSGKMPPGAAKLANVPQKDYFKHIFRQYEELLAWLKVGGALLNTIRPEYLLSMSDFNRYLKSTPDLLQLRPRQIERRWLYFSMDSWVTLFYQIIRLYALARVTPKAFKSIPGVTVEKALIEESMTKSNIYSLSECILLRWLSIHFANIYPMTSRKVRNFDQDLLDGTVIAAVVQSHMGAVGSLSKVKFNPLNDDQRKGNIEKVISALNDSGMPTFLTLRDLIGSYISPREMVLFCVSLFQGLPHYIPKCTIEFPCVLGDRVTRTLELENPSNKQVTYWVRLEGSTDFLLPNSDDLLLDPHSTAPFPITFLSRISNPVTGKVRFTSRGGEGASHASALVFNLASKVHSRRSMKVIEVEAHLYELIVKEIELLNPFNKDADFGIQMIMVQKEQTIPSDKAKSTIKKKPQHLQTKPHVVFPNPFSLKFEKIKVKKASSIVLQLVYQPFEFESQEMHIIFIDEAVGEMQYSVKGTVLPPRVDKADRLEFKREMGAISPIEVPITSRNRLFERAKTELYGRLPPSTKSKERELLKEIFNNLLEETTVFDLVITSPFFTGPTTFSITDVTKGKTALDISQITTFESSMRPGDLNPADSRLVPKPKKRNSLSRSQSIATGSEKVTLLVLGFAPKQPGEYSCQLSLMNKQKTDIRAMELAVSVKPKKTNIALEMVARARTSVTQEIPISNTSDKDWAVKVRLTQDSDLFSVSKDFQVRRRTTGSCTVTFKPDWVCQATAKLELDVPLTGELHEFQLTGKGVEPIAEDHIVIPCRVKERSTHKIPVPNLKTNSVLYKVVSDLRFATGEAIIEVPASSTGYYEISMYPLQSGTYTGSITFSDPWNHFYWYTLEVQSTSPEPESVKELRVQCRKAVEMKITVYNPLAETTVFDVILTGDGLYGESKFSIPAKETRYYSLLYSPLIPNQSDGSIFFVSEKTGEFWYKIRLICEAQEPVELEIFVADVGKSIAKAVTLDNPSNQEAFLDYICTNPANFEMIPDTVIIPAYGSLEVLIRYTPTSLNTLETADIMLSSRIIGNWVFKLQGQGSPPSSLDPMLATAAIGESTSIQVPFKNPFRDTVSVSVALETDAPEIFQLLLRKAKFQVAPMSLLMIPVAFKPLNMEERGAQVIVSASPQLNWVYPVRGVTERPSYKIDFVFKAKCRTKLERQIDVFLSDMPETIEDENFNHELKIASPELANLVFKCFKIDPLKNILKSPTEPLQFMVMFEPLRPFKTDAELLIYKASGGRWRYNLTIEAKEPDIDDTIVIESPMRKPASVAFRLANHFKQYASFESFFKTDSDPCFSVRPEKGILEPYGREGTQFIVTFTPLEYGFPKSGKLVIRTDEMQWSFLVKGTHPAYVPPTIQKSTIDDRLSPEQKTMVSVAQRLTKKNYIKENIQGQRVSPKKSAVENTEESQ